MASSQSIDVANNQKEHSNVQDHHADPRRVAQRSELGKGFKARYEGMGYTVIAPSWPLDDRPPAELRATPHPDLKNVGMKRILDHYDHAIRALPEAPILIGHSFGGTITQHLLDRGLGAAGVAIDPAPTSGILVGWDTIKSTFPVFLS